MKVSLLSPKKCIFCLRACEDELPVCYKCIHKFQTLLNEPCLECGKPPSVCQCNETESIRFLFYFGSLPSRSIIYKVKYRADVRVLRFLVELLMKSSGIDPTKYDCVTYVPRIRRNIARYGYDQSKELAKAISYVYGIPVVRSLKRVGGKDQKLLSYSERKRNIRGRYMIMDPPETKYKRVLLIDDVTTTGATVNACAAVLRKDFAKMVTPVVLAKTNVPKR